MVNGWALDGAIQDQIDASIEDEISRSRNNLPTGQSLRHCQECGKAIPDARRQAMLGVRLCIDCQELINEKAVYTGYNRRASKDSQLR